MLKVTLTAVPATTFEPVFTLHLLTLPKAFNFDADRELLRNEILLNSGVLKSHTYGRGAGVKVRLSSLLLIINYSTPVTPAFKSNFPGSRLLR